MALLDDVRSELQLDSSDMSDDSINYAITKVGETFALVCAQVLRMLLNKNRGRRQLTLGSFNESVDVSDIRARIRYYMEQHAAISGEDAGGYVDIEDTDYIFTKEGI